MKSSEFIFISAAWTRPTGLPFFTASFVSEISPLQRSVGKKAHCEDILANGGGGFSFGSLGFARMDAWASE